MKGISTMHTTKILLLCGLLTCANVQAALMNGSPAGVWASVNIWWTTATATS